MSCELWWQSLVIKERSVICYVNDLTNMWHDSLKAAIVFLYKGESNTRNLNKQS